MHISKADLKNSSRYAQLLCPLENYIEFYGFVDALTFLKPILNLFFHIYYFITQMHITDKMTNKRSN